MLGVITRILPIIAMYNAVQVQSKNQTCLRVFCERKPIIGDIFRKYIENILKIIKLYIENMIENKVALKKIRNSDQRYAVSKRC